MQLLSKEHVRSSKEWIFRVFKTSTLESFNNFNKSLASLAGLDSLDSLESLKSSNSLEDFEALGQGWGTFFYEGPATNSKMCGPHVKKLW